MPQDDRVRLEDLLLGVQAFLRECEQNEPTVREQFKRGVLGRGNFDWYVSQGGSDNDGDKLCNQPPNGKP